MEHILQKIKEIRTEKGYSQEYMSVALDMSISAYTKLENSITKLTVERLFKIAEILETPVEQFISEGSGKTFNQTIEPNGTGYQQEILNLYMENKERTEELIQAKNEIINQLKSSLSK